MKSNNKYNRSEIFKLAHSFIKKYGVSLSEALQIAWRNAKLKNELHERIAHFYFQKTDGTIREAWGTLVEDRLPQTQGTGRKPSENVQVYFDTEKEEWRCFKKINLVAIAS